VTGPTGQLPDRPADEAAALREDTIEELYENAPCGDLSTLPDGTIAKVNATLLGWLGYTRDELVGRRRFSDLLTVGGRIYHETHFAPLLQMQGEVGGVALEMRAADGTRLPVLVTSTVKTSAEGKPLLIRTTVFDARDRRAYEQELLRARREAERDRERLRHLVVGLQRSLLPAALPAPPGMRTAAHYHMASADEVGGDFYDLFPLRDGRWGFFLGDVCGKGVEAAAATATARYTLRAAAVYDPTPAAALANLNAVLFQEYRAETHRHCTVVFGILTPDGDGYSATVASGGHPPAALLHADGTVAYQHTTGGTLIGILPEVRIVTRTVRLAPGDTLILYTDGLTEARVDTAGKRFGSEALRRFIVDRAPTDAPGAVAALAELLGTFPDGLHDDAAVMALGVTGPPTDSSRPPAGSA
jgi:phosphoserine phosphatase RsbU/P